MTTEILIGLMIACVLWASTASVLIARDLVKRGLPVSILWLRLKIFKYLGQYRQITREETGRIGPLFYHYVVPFNLALVLVVVLAFAWRA